MRSALILSTLASLVLANIPKDAQWYTLSTKSASSSPSNLYLSSKDGKVAAYPGTRESASKAAKFFTTPYNETLSLHPGTDANQISLQGRDGLFGLVDLAEPKGSFEIPTMWSVFTIGPRGNVGIKDGSNIPSRTWVSWEEADGSVAVGLWDGVSPQTKTLSNITLTANKVTVRFAGPSQ